MTGVEIASVSIEFNIIAPRPIQTSVLGTVETVYKPIAPGLERFRIFDSQ